MRPGFHGHPTAAAEEHVKLGDAIIAATALEYGVPMVTQNEGDFKHIAGLQIINPFAEDSPA